MWLLACRRAPICGSDACACGRIGPSMKGGRTLGAVCVCVCVCVCGIRPKNAHTPVPRITCPAFSPQVTCGCRAGPGGGCATPVLFGGGAKPSSCPGFPRPSKCFLWSPWVPLDSLWFRWRGEAPQLPKVSPRRRRRRRRRCHNNVWGRRWYSLSWFGSVSFDLASFGSAWLGLAWFGLV